MLDRTGVRLTDLPRREGLRARPCAVEGGEFRLFRGLEKPPGEVILVLGVIFEVLERGRPGGGVAMVVV